LNLGKVIRVSQYFFQEIYYAKEIPEFKGCARRFSTASLGSEKHNWSNEGGSKSPSVIFDGRASKFYFMMNSSSYFEAENMKTIDGSNIAFAE
jgi:hypothetical protein